MTNQEMLVRLKGTKQDQQSLFDYFFEKISNGETLQENEYPIFEALKKILVKPSEIFTMSGAASGSGGVNG